ncbi:MAG: glycosyl hydrolase family 28 protein [Verrucomicrobiota bacterium]
MTFKLSAFIARAALATLILAAPLCPAAQVFEIRQFGAVGDGKVADTAAIQKAIEAASAAGGGTVNFSPGTYLSGSIRLKSHVKLHLEPGATLLGSPQRFDYRKLNFYALVWADNETDIGITGKGVIDGQGKILAKGYELPVTQGKWPDAREGERPVIINFRNCQRVTMRDVTLRESACWVQLYRDCNDVSIENIKVRTMAAITNDGLDIDGCKDVVVRGCDIDSEDDGICLKSTRRACENILIENCRVRSSCNALKFGTASFAGFKNIICRNLELYDTYLSAMALELVDGGVMENVQITNVKITDCNNPLFLRLGHRNADGLVGSVSNVSISNVTAEIPNRPKSAMNKFPTVWQHRCQTLVTASITGQPGHPVRDVTLKDISIVYGGIGATQRTNHHHWAKLDEVPERAESYPESTMFGVLPAWGFYLRHAEGIRFENVTLRTKAEDYRPAMVADGVRQLQVDNLQVKSAGKEPVIVLRDVQGATFTNTPVPPKSAPFIKTLGNTRNLSGS